MKILLAGIIGFASLTSLASTCDVTSKYNELESGLNKQAICRATIESITGEYTLSEGSVLVIEANGERSKYTVELTKIKLFQDGNIEYSGSGRLTWNPDGEWVTLN